METKNYSGLIIGVIIVLLFGTIFYFTSSDTEDGALNQNITQDHSASMESDAMMEGNSMEKTDDATMGNDTMTLKQGSYESYSPEKIAMKSETGNVVLFFHAAWCPTCRNLDKDIKANLKNIPADLSILNTDYDDSASLKQKYGVTYQHTLVQVDKDGNLINKFFGSPTLASLVSEVQK